MKKKSVYFFPTVIVGFIIAMMLLVLVQGCSFSSSFAPAEPTVAVKIYKHIESGNLIYCETGTLTDEFHTYQGEGVIAESKAVAC